MDPNFVQATLSGYLASSRHQDRDSALRETEKVAEKPARRGWLSVWMTPMGVRMRLRTQPYRQPRRNAFE